MSLSKSAAFFDAVKIRRSQYTISSEPILTDSELKTLVEQAVLHAPSVFNSQSGRAVLLTGEANQKVWDIVTEQFLGSIKDNETLHQIMTNRLAMSRSGYGTVLFFEDLNVIESLRKTARMPHFTPEHFDVWSEKSTGMLQFIVWTALSVEGYGASIQHHASYVKSINPSILAAFDLPKSWKCTSLMPFGKPVGPPGMPGREKTFEPIEKRTLCFQK